MVQAINLYMGKCEIDTELNECQLLNLNVSITLQCVLIVTCSLGHPAHIVNATVQPVKDADQMSDSIFAKMHAVCKV